MMTKHLNNCDCGCIEFVDIVIEIVHQYMIDNEKPRDSSGRIPHPYEGWGYLCEIEGHMKFCNCTPSARGEI